MRALRRSGGFTMVEASIGVALLATIAVGVGGVMRASGGLARRAHAAQLASQQNRRSLERIANALRCASLDSLAGFDGNGLSTAPQFKTVTGAANGTPVLGATQTIQWYANTDRCGAPDPGQVDCVVDGVRTCMAQRVASGGFRTALSGSTIKVFLTTYVPDGEGGVANVSGVASVSIRN